MNSNYEDYKFNIQSLRPMQFLAMHWTKLLPGKPNGSKRSLGLRYGFGCFGTYYKFSPGRRWKWSVFSHSVWKVLCREVGWVHLNTHFAFSPRWTQSCSFGGRFSPQRQASLPSQSVSPGDSPSTMPQIQRGLSSPFELPLTPNCEETKGRLRLQGIYFILSACTIEEPSLRGEQTAPVS